MAHVFVFLQTGYYPNTDQQFAQEVEDDQPTYEEIQANYAHLDEVLNQIGK